MNETNPFFQRFMLLIHGVDSIESYKPLHCVIGLNDGVLYNIHQSASNGTFIGVDSNSANSFKTMRLFHSVTDEDDHIFNESLDDFLQRENKFDSISVQLNYSRLSYEDKDSLKKFVKNSLKPGGIFYINYDASPGYNPPQFDFHRSLFFEEVIQTFDFLDYVCSLDEPDESLTDKQVNFLQSIEQPPFHEQMKDLFFNRSYRKDLFVNGVVKLTDAEKFQRLKIYKFALIDENADDEVSNYIKTDGFYPKTFDEIQRVVNNSLPQLLELIRKNIVVPCKDRSVQTVNQCSKLNKILCNRSEFEEVKYLVSPITYGEIAVDNQSMQIMKLMHIGRNDEKYITEKLSVANADDVVKEFITKKLPMFKSIQLI